jgi:hypothetical protein
LGVGALPGNLDSPNQNPWIEMPNNVNAMYVMSTIVITTETNTVGTSGR